MPLYDLVQAIPSGKLNMGNLQKTYEYLNLVRVRVLLKKRGEGSCPSNMVRPSLTKKAACTTRLHSSRGTIVMWYLFVSLSSHKCVRHIHIVELLYSLVGL